MFQVHGVRQGAAAGGAVVQSQAGAVHTAAPLPAGWRQRRLWPGGDKRRGAGCAWCRSGPPRTTRTGPKQQGSAVLPEIATGGAPRPPPSDVAELGSRAAAPGATPPQAPGGKFALQTTDQSAQRLISCLLHGPGAHHQSTRRGAGGTAPAGRAQYGALFAAHLARAVGPAARLFPPRGTYFKRHLASTLSAPGPRFSPPHVLPR